MQTPILYAAGCEIIRAEKALGSSQTGMSEWQLLLGFLRPDDTLRVFAEFEEKPAEISALFNNQLDLPHR